MDSIDSVILPFVEVQANGIIRNSKGLLIGKLIDKIDYNGEHILGDSKKCNNPEHNFPIGLYIIPGQVVTHTCPSCKMSKTYTAPIIT